MKLAPLSISIALLLASFGAGRHFGASAQKNPATSSYVQPQSKAARPAEGNSPAMQRALVASQNSSYFMGGELYEAVQNLSNEEVRKMIEMLGAEARRDTSALRALLLERRAEFDPESTAAAVLRLPDSVKFVDAQGLVAAWASASPAAALAEADRLPEKNGKRAALTAAALTALAKKDPAAAVARAKTLSASKENDALLASALSRWLEKAPEAGTKWLVQNLQETKTGADGSPFVDAVIRLYAARNLAGAEQLLALLPDTVRKSATYSVAQEMTMSQPVATLDWCLKNGISPFEKGTALLGDNPNPNGGQAPFVPAVFRDREGVTAWVMNHPDPEIRERGIRALMGTEPDLKNILALFAKRSLESQGDSVALLSVIERIKSKGTFEMATNFIQTLSTTELRLAAVNPFMRYYVMHDSDAVKTWIRTLPPGEHRDLSAITYLRQGGMIDSEAEATEWVGLLVDLETKKDEVCSFYRSYMKKDPARAERWISALPNVSVKFKAALRVLPHGLPDMELNEK